MPIASRMPLSHPLVSIIIPTKDHANILDNCIKSIVEKSTYDNFELVIIENNSTEKETFDYYDKLQAKYPDIVRLVTWKHEFNFSKLMNFGVAHAKGDYLLLLNNDTGGCWRSWCTPLLSRQHHPARGLMRHWWRGRTSLPKHAKG